MAQIKSGGQYARSQRQYAAMQAMGDYLLTDERETDGGQVWRRVATPSIIAEYGGAVTAPEVEKCSGRETCEGWPERTPTTSSAIG